MVRILFSFSLVFLSGLLCAGFEKPSKDSSSSKSAQTTEELTLPQEEEAKPRPITSEMKKKQCDLFEGKIISFYDNVFKVEHCKRRPILLSRTVSDYLQKGIKVHNVESITLAALPEGQPVDVIPADDPGRNCKQLDGKYVTYSYVDVYFIESCKRRLFKDWDSYLRHRKKKNDELGEILALTWQEFNNLHQGQDMPSFIDEEFRKLLQKAADADVIPIDEACRGVEGHYASYYSKIYKIEKCRKREIDDRTLFARKTADKSFVIVELTSEQWLSLPDGKPIVDKSLKREPPK